MSTVQTYTVPAMPPLPVNCTGCGCLVSDVEAHDEWHRKTRSIV